MSMNRIFVLMLLHATFWLALVGSGLQATNVVAQERRSSSDDERSDDDRREERRGRFGFSRRDRAEEDRDRGEDREESSNDRKSASDEKESSTKSDDAPSIATQDYVKGLVKLHDKNENRMIDGDELKGLRPPASLADANGDKVITIDELNAKFTQSASNSSASTTTKSIASSDATKDRDRGGSSEKDDDSGGSPTTSKRVLTWLGAGKPGEDAKSKRRTYRFTPAGERLPTGLPSWFKSQDKNGDGQVSMNEYSRSWSRSTVSKFERYDLDGEGVVTSKEAKKQETP
jgi:hypothetical protein